MAKSKGHLVNFAWLWSKAHKLQAEIAPNVKIKQYVIVTFLQRYQIKMGSKQRNKKKPKGEKVPALMKWHATFREKCIHSGMTEPGCNTKWGRYKPEERLNIDQSPLPFVVHRKRTYEYIPSGEGATHNTWIAQPSAGLEKGQCTLQSTFRSEGKQPKLAVIFHGKVKRISNDEKQAWHPDIDVFWQDNVWLDQHVCLKWFEKTLLRFLRVRIIEVCFAS